MKQFLHMYFEAPTDNEGGEPEIKPIETDEPPKNEPKTFTQDELNSLLANEKKSAKAKILKDLGVEDADKIKELIKKQKEDEDANKSALEKLEDLNKTLQEKSTKLSEYESRDKAIELGVDVSKAKEFVKLANTIGEGDSIEDKIKFTLEKYPFYKTGSTPKPFGIKTGGKPNTLDDDLNTVKKFMNM